MTLLELTEWGEAIEFMPTAEETAVLRLLRDRTNQHWLPNGAVRIGPRQGYVGSAMLSSKTTLVVKPKVPIRNLLDLISLAYRTTRLPTDPVETSLQEGAVQDWLTLLLTLEIESLIRDGLRNGYVDRHEFLSFIRGRIDFQRSVRGGGASTLVLCEFTDFVADTAENRLLLGTLILMTKSRLHSEVRTRVDWLMHSLDGVETVEPTISSFDSIQLSRLNRQYEPALRLARLFVASGGLSHRTGDVQAPGFFLPMEHIFEAAIANECSDRFRAVRKQPPFGNLFAHKRGAPAHAITIRPDITIGAAPGLVMDTKYAAPTRPTRFGGEGFKNDHIYQIATYAKAFSTSGILIYPQVREQMDVLYDFRGTDIRILTVDLMRDGLAGIQTLMDRLSAILGNESATSGSRAHLQETHS